MMEKGPLAELLVERFETMPRQLQVAARYVLDHPRDVALMSMREQAQQAGVSHTTMMRLARWLGLDGYEDMRSLYADAVRTPALPAGARSDHRADKDDAYPTVGVVADTLAAQVASLGEYETAKQLIAAAEALAAGRNLFSLALRSEYPVAVHFADILRQLGNRVVLLDAPAGRGIDALAGAGEGDAMLAVAFSPYCHATIETARQAAQQGVSVVAVTDSSVSPLARMAKESVIVSGRSQSFFRSVTPALAVAEILAALIAAGSGKDAEQAVRDAEERLASLGVYWKPPR